MPEDKLINALESWQEKYLAAIGEGIQKYDIVGSGALGKSFKINQPKVKLFGSTYVMQDNCPTVLGAVELWKRRVDSRLNSWSASRQD
jgi:hypothetical protein